MGDLEFGSTGCGFPSFPAEVGALGAQAMTKLQLRDDSEGKLSGYTDEQRYKTDARHLYTHPPPSLITLLGRHCRNTHRHPLRNSCLISLASIAELTSSHRQHAHTPCLYQRAQRSPRTILRRYQCALLHSSCCSTKPSPSPSARRRQARRGRRFQREAARVPRRAYHGPEESRAARA
jgi:hypothetical protein